MERAIMADYPEALPLHDNRAELYRLLATRGLWIGRRDRPGTEYHYSNSYRDTYAWVTDNKADATNSRGNRIIQEILDAIDCLEYLCN